MRTKAASEIQSWQAGTDVRALSCAGPDAPWPPLRCASVASLRFGRRRARPPGDAGLGQAAAVRSAPGGTSQAHCTAAPRRCAAPPRQATRPRHRAVPGTGRPPNALAWLARNAALSRQATKPGRQPLAQAGYHPPSSGLCQQQRRAPVPFTAPQPLNAATQAGLWPRAVGAVCVRERALS